jgi:rod shape-determining protein MreC
VHNKQVRRRRAALAALVVASLILLTAYFGASSSSPLHQVQRGIVEVLSPVEEGASKVLSPVRDVAGWFSSTFRAKSQVAGLKKQVHQLDYELAQLQGAALQNRQLRAQVHLDATSGIAAYNPVSANVYGHDPQLWFATIDVDKGSDDGVALNDPVIGDRGLVGVVTTVDPTVSVVTLITDHAYSVSAEVQDQQGDQGVLVPETGNPNALLLQDLPTHAQITKGQLVVTTGFKDGSLQSLYPPNIPIGTVSDANQDQLVQNQQVQVTPLVDLRHLTAVQILTRPHGNTVSASAHVTTTAQVGGGG